MPSFICSSAEASDEGLLHPFQINLISIFLGWYQPNRRCLLVVITACVINVFGVLMYTIFCVEYTFRLCVVYDENVHPPTATANIDNGPRDSGKKDNKHLFNAILSSSFFPHYLPYSALWFGMSWKQNSEWFEREFE